ncbi:MAG: FAD-binding oxidoreductase [Chloracidobacterium sp.]|nr:FAD-binding oxidoreductase [Chloracidobacterium sp.]
MQTKTQPDEIQNYLSDASFIQGGTAERLFLPESAVEVADILREANAAGVPVTIAGARTGTVGGAIPFGGYVVSMERLNKIVSIDKEAMTAVVQPGVILGDLQKAVEAEGLFYPPDPTERICQIGGNVATNASGARSFKYGATRDYVKAVKVVLADGESLDLRRSCGLPACQVNTESGRVIEFAAPTYSRPRVRKNASGYFAGEALDPIDLFIGSEGTLGVIVEIELALLPKPEGFFSGIVFFADQSDLLAFVNEARLKSWERRKNPVATAPGSDIDATLLEYFDAHSLGFIRERFPETPEGMAWAVFFEQETSAENEDAVFEAWNALLEKHNADTDRSWFTTNEQDREKMRSFRHAMPLAANERFARNGFKKVSTDMAVPPDRFRSFLKFYDDLLAPSGIEYVIFGHIGDCHLHANLFPKTEAENERARHLYGRCVAQAIMLGGTVSAEHGIGKLKRKYLAAMMGERYLNEMAEIKRSFDPKGILGRGNMFDESYL